jgi:hypothetical protein
MNRTVVLLACASAILGADLGAQTIPEGSQASRIDLGYLRSPQFGVDPFRHLFIPRWGFVTLVGASGQNNAVNFKDVGALKFLTDDSTNPDGLLYGDILDVLGLIPRGTGLALSAQSESGAYLGGPFGRHFSLGFTAQLRAYGGALLDDDFVSLLRDGNEDRQDFSLGESRFDVLAAGEIGAHALIRLGPVGTVDGAYLSLGFGGRYVVPFYYARGASTIANGGLLRVTGDGVTANIALEKAVAITGETGGWGSDTTLSMMAGDLFKRKGSGIAGDFLVRLVWPTSGLALEAMVANIGKVTVRNVELADWSYNVATTDLKEVLDSLDAFPESLYPDSVDIQFREFEVSDTLDLDVTLPRIVRFTGSAWANRILQLDVSATLPVKGDFASPLTVDLGSTWRFSRTIPIRLGLVFGGNQGLGYTGGIGIEGRNFLTRFQGGSLGGFIKNATGVGGRFELGFFF